MNRPTQTAELLVEAAKMLYGENWVASLGRALKVDPRTLKRFANGDFMMQKDHPMLRDLIVIMSERRDELKTLSDRIAANMAPVQRKPIPQRRTSTAA